MWSPKSCYSMSLVVETLRKTDCGVPQDCERCCVWRIFGIQTKLCIFFAIFNMHSLAPSFKGSGVTQKQLRRGKKNRNYLSSSYLFGVLENGSDNGLPIICDPLSVNFSINWARGLLTNKIYYSSENTLFRAPDLQSISLVIAIKLSWKLIYAIVFPL